MYACIDGTKNNQMGAAALPTSTPISSPSQMWIKRYVYIFDNISISHSSSQPFKKEMCAIRNATVRSPPLWEILLLIHIYTRGRPKQQGPSKMTRQCNPRCVYSCIPQMSVLYNRTARAYSSTGNVPLLSQVFSRLLAYSQPVPPSYAQSTCSCFASPHLALLRDTCRALVLLSSSSLVFCVMWIRLVWEEGAWRQIAVNRCR